MLLNSQHQHQPSPSRFVDASNTAGVGIPTDATQEISCSS